MGELSVQIIFGWPAVITSILLSIAGAWLKKPALLVTAGILCMPFIYYISGGFRSPAAVLPLLKIGSAYAIMHQKIQIAWLLILPLIIVSVALTYAVLTQ